MRWCDTYTLFRWLLMLVVTICFLTIILALADLQIIYDYTEDVSEDPYWFRVLLCICEFGIWYGVYLSTFLVSYTYFQASL